MHSMASESVMFLLPMSFVPAIHFYDPAMKGNGVSDSRGGEEWDIMPQIRHAPAPCPEEGVIQK